MRRWMTTRRWTLMQCIRCSVYIGDHPQSTGVARWDFAGPHCQGCYEYEYYLRQPWDDLVIRPVRGQWVGVPGSHYCYSTTITDWIWTALHGACLSNEAIEAVQKVERSKNNGR
jgi:hypothetical protein